MIQAFLVRESLLLENQFLQRIWNSRSLLNRPEVILTVFLGITLGHKSRLVLFNYAIGTRLLLNTHLHPIGFVSIWTINYLTSLIIHNKIHFTLWLIPSNSQCQEMNPPLLWFLECHLQCIKYSHYHDFAVLYLLRFFVTTMLWSSGFSTCVCSVCSIGTCFFRR